MISALNKRFFSSSATSSRFFITMVLVFFLSIKKSINISELYCFLTPGISQQDKFNIVWVINAWGNDQFRYGLMCQVSVLAPLHLAPRPIGTQRCYQMEDQIR